MKVFVALLLFTSALIYVNACNQFGIPSLPPFSFPCPPCSAGSYPGVLPGTTQCQCLNCVTSPYACPAGTWNSTTCRCVCTAQCPTNFYGNPATGCQCICNIARCANGFPPSPACTC